MWTGRKQIRPFLQAHMNHVVVAAVGNPHRGHHGVAIHSLQSTGRLPGPAPPRLDRRAGILKIMVEADYCMQCTAATWRGAAGPRAGLSLSLAQLPSYLLRGCQPGHILFGINT